MRWHSLVLSEAKSRVAESARNAKERKRTGMRSENSVRTRQSKLRARSLSEWPPGLKVGLQVALQACSCRIVGYSEVTWFWGTSDRALNLRFGTACLRSLLSPGVGCQGIELLNVIRIEIAPCFLFTHHHKKLFRRIRLSNAPCCTAVFSGALEL